MIVVIITISAVVFFTGFCIMCCKDKCKKDVSNLLLKG